MEATINMDITTLSLAKKYANKVAAGFSNVEVQGNNLIFTFFKKKSLTIFPSQLQFILNLHHVFQNKHGSISG